VDRNQASTKGIYSKNGVIQLRFLYQGQRVSPSVLSDAYNERNIRKWAERLNGPKGIKTRIKLGQFDFAAEFPDYRFMARIAPEAAAQGEQTLNDVVKRFLDDCEFKVRREEMAWSTMNDYRKKLAKNWQAGHDREGKPLKGFGQRAFFSIKLSELREHLRKHEGSKKSYNNIVSGIRCVFEFGYMDKPAQNPALGLKCVRLLAKDKRAKDPFSIEEAERIIAGTREIWGEEQALYEEVRFFTGMRPSEQIALEVSDFDAKAGTLHICKARVEARDKAYTKTGVDRTIELSPRSLVALQRLLLIRAKLKLVGKIDHERLFIKADGSAFHDLQVQQDRWNVTLPRIGVRRRDPYNARHSSVSWNLMVQPEKLLWIAEQHGHSVAVMLKDYAAWTKGAKEADVAAIREAMQRAPRQLLKAA
jgi:integrase